MEKKSFFFIVFTAWELLRIAFIFLYLTTTRPCSTIDFAPLLAGFLSGNLLLPFAALLIYFSPQKRGILHPLLVMGKMMTTASVFFGIIFLFGFFLTHQNSDTLLQFTADNLSLPLIILFVDLIFLAVLLSLKREDIPEQ
ncbi:MAG: hypothetical protein JW904_02505 [Spirochaetales bacterium]|nr:hypothetical protein [Spirochaetales bacterium]